MRKNPSESRSKKDLEDAQAENEAIYKLANKPPGKKGKFKKDFNEGINKMLKDLDLVPDKTGKIKPKDKKKEMTDYNPTLKPQKLKNIDPKKLNEGIFTYPQNTMKKPKTKGQQIKKEDMITKGILPGLQKKKSNHSSLGKPYENKKDKTQNGKKKDFPKFKGFEDYMDFSEVEKKIEAGELYQGVFIRNDRNPRANFIKCPLFDQKILFKNFEDENRAMHNSIVVFKITSGRPKKVAQNQKDQPRIILEDDEEEKVEVEEFNQENDLSPQEALDLQDQDDDEGEEEKEAEGQEDFDLEGVDLDEQKKIMLEIARNLKQGNELIDAEVSDNDEEGEDDEEDAEGEEIEDDDGESEEEKVNKEEVPQIVLKEGLEEFGFELKATVENENDSDDQKNFHTRYHPPIRMSRNQNSETKKRGKSSSASESKSERYEEGKKCFAKIVYILDNPQMQRKFVVKLKRNPYWQEALFRGEPIESQIPVFDLITFAPEIPTKSETIESYYLAEYVYWPTNNKYPFGQIVDEIGTAGAVDIESEALLQNYDVYNKDFGPDTYEYLRKYESRCDPVTMEYRISEEEIRGREDLRDSIVFTCDPKTARDLDDALSVKYIGNKTYEIGVHIADVSHFVQEKTPLDEEARLRTTTVYLVHKAIPMLPHLLCQNLCSLNPGLERLTFSCFFYVSDEGVVLDLPPRITKSIIKTCIRFDYDMLQEVFDGKITDEKDLPVLFYPTGTEKGDIIKACHVMNGLAQKIRAKRFETGSMSFERNKYRFELDGSNYPIGIQVDKRKESSFMVEEYMLLANRFVGKFIVDTCTEIGVLRCHPPPSTKRIDLIQNLLGKLNLKMEFTSSKAIQESLKLIVTSPEVPEAYKAIIKAKMCKLMEAAKYFVVEDLGPEHWRHYALNFDIYTHFTSPIRRYPDVLVHRLAEKCIQYKQNVKEHVNKYLMLSIMDKCNNCKLNSKRVSDASEKIFLSLYLRNNPAHTQAIVIFCSNNAIELYVPLVEQEIKIETKQIKNLKKAVKGISNNLSTLDLEYQADNKSPAISIKLKEYAYVSVYITGTNEFPIDLSLKLVHDAAGKKTILE